MCCCDSVGKRVKKSMESGSAPFCMLLYSALTCMECGDSWREIQGSNLARELWWLKLDMLCLSH